MALANKLQHLEKYAELPPRIKITELRDERGYQIVYCKRITTQHGPAIVIHFLNEGVKGSTFLPKRFVNYLSDEDIEEISTSSKFKFYCVGMIKRSPDIKIWKE